MIKRKNLLQTVLVGIALIMSVGLYLKFRYQKFEAPRQNSPTIEYIIGKDNTLEAVINDLQYFDFIKDKEAFRYALSASKDQTPAIPSSLLIGNNSIDREAKYKISQSMTAWQIADVLLNQGESAPCDRGCSESNFNPELLPGGDLSPTIQQKYEWVKTYEDCVKSIGHDGGQLSSEQYAQKTGIRKCVSPDSREFTQGKEGWVKAVGG